jgi:hypothetical protein
LDGRTAGKVCYHVNFYVIDFLVPVLYGNGKACGKAGRDVARRGQPPSLWAHTYPFANRENGECRRKVLVRQTKRQAELVPGRPQVG